MRRLLTPGQDGDEAQDERVLDERLTILALTERLQVPHHISPFQFFGGSPGRVVGRPEGKPVTAD